MRAHLIAVTTASAGLAAALFSGGCASTGSSDCLWPGFATACRPSAAPSAGACGGSSCVPTAGLYGYQPTCWSHWPGVWSACPTPEAQSACPSMPIAPGRDPSLAHSGSRCPAYASRSASPLQGPQLHAPGPADSEVLSMLFEAPPPSRPSERIRARFLSKRLIRRDLSLTLLLLNR